MESKHTNRAIAFLCSNYSFCLDEMDSLIDLASNRCLMHRKSHLIFYTSWTSIFALNCAIGAHSAGEIPVYIPNTEVKPSSGDNTATAGR